jgi:hypothetical protein
MSTERARAAIASAGSGLLAGALAYAATGTAKVVLSPGLEAASPLDLLVGTFLVFVGGLLWALIGGALFLLLPSSALFFGLASRTRTGGPGAPTWLAASAVLWAGLFAPLFVFGLRGRIVDGVLLGLSLGIGVSHGMRQLARRIAPR